MPRNKSEKKLLLRACAEAWAVWLPLWKIYRRTRSNHDAEQKAYRTYSEAQGALSDCEQDQWAALNFDQRRILGASQ